MNIVFRNIKITRLKLLIAKVLYLLVRLFYRKHSYIVSRQDITMELHLNEGIDLNLFLLGSFQKHITDNSMITLPSNGIVIDVGANAGIMALIYAKKVPDGEVHAFEPTSYAFEKFRRNLALNPMLAKRIKLLQCFVSNTSAVKSSIKAFSSWPIMGSVEKHAIHGGVDMTTDGVNSITLDSYCADFHKLDLIKIDTDGHELKVLRGASATLLKYRPRIIFEIGCYVMEEQGICMEDYFIFFEKHRYKLYTTNGSEILVSNYAKQIPKYGTVDLIALPDIE